MTHTDKILAEFNDKKYSIHKQSCDVMCKHGMQICNCDGKSFLSTSIKEALAEERERVVEAMMMKGIEAKMTPFQTTVNQYLRNRAEEIGIDLSSLDKTKE